MSGCKGDACAGAGPSEPVSADYAFVQAEAVQRATPEDVMAAVVRGDVATLKLLLAQPQCAAVANDASAFPSAAQLLGRHPRRAETALLDAGVPPAALRGLQARDLVVACRDVLGTMRRSPLFVAAARSPQCVAPLVQAAAAAGQEQSRSWGGQTPLHVACTAQVAWQLLRGHWDPHAAGVGGQTPLHKACQYGRPGVVLVLLLAGADAEAGAQCSVPGVAGGGPSPPLAWCSPPLQAPWVNFALEGGGGGVAQGRRLCRVVLETFLRIDLDSESAAATSGCSRLSAVRSVWRRLCLAPLARVCRRPIETLSAALAGPTRSGTTCATALVWTIVLQWLGPPPSGTKWDLPAATLARLSRPPVT